MAPMEPDCEHARYRRTIVSYTHAPVYAMQTDIVLDEKLVKAAMKLASVKARREAVDVALRRFAHSRKQKRRLLDLQGEWRGSEGLRP
jgi:Arc/MetJ family transcription regulator